MLLVLLLLAGSCTAGLSQAVLPAPEAAKHAITFDLAGNTPLIGVSYHQQLIQFANVHHAYTGAIEVSAGFGYVPSICIFGCSADGLSTHHSLLLLWGRKLQGEFGYAGFLTPKGLLYEQAYLPGAIAGLRYSPKSWLLRLYIAGMIVQENGTGITVSGDLAWQKKTYLLPIPGLSIGRRF